MMRRPFRLMLFSPAVIVWFVATAHFSPSAPKADREKETAPNSQETSRTELKPFNLLVGFWRGVGQPRSNSTRGAWIESAQWRWDFQNQQAAVLYTVTGGKQFRSIRFTVERKKTGDILLRAEVRTANHQQRIYRGKWNGNKLQLLSEIQPDGLQYRLTITRLNDKRTLLLHEQRRGNAGPFLRMAGVGYTRKGVSLAASASGEPECIVTGGKGTMPVSYRGKTYYVCCSGCRQAFEDDPAGIIAEYQKRLAAKRKKAAP